ncbi:hypothetical protein M153_340000906 [Pseudoloma neurophilia]|uniref:Uncharacterized protein n=1 Tax=Pseudoloma neurophilia TaxID=146866 RepID=A0A0R0LY36_9MICR|nr:hypothetical protein M153_340000906 [Pseudoloma neurophilia]
MTNNDKKITYIERIIIDDCTCKPYNINDPDGNNKEYPTLNCGITCKKNDIVKQQCFCYECSRCIAIKSCDSDHLLSLEKLKTLSTSDSESKKLIKNCIEGRDKSIKEIDFIFDNMIDKNTFNSTLRYSKVNNEKKKILFPENLHFPIDIFENPNDIQIGTEETNQNPTNILNKNLEKQKTHSEMDLSQESYDINKNNQISVDSIGNCTIATAIIGSLFFVSALFIGLGFLYKKYRKKTTKTNLEDSKNVI